jgi:hypothetical protein
MDYGPKGSPAVGRALPGLPVRGRSAASNANPTTAWVRNVDWPVNPIPAAEGFSGLYAVYDNASNFVALSAAGDFTVNWGDGTGNTNVSSGVQAETNIVYANVSGNPVGTSSAVACTFTDSGDTVNLTAHGWQNGQVVNFAAITSTTGISTFTKYYIVNRAADTFQVSTTIGGGAVALTTDGSGTVFVPLYKVAVITAVGNGGTLTNINLQKIHSQSGLSVHSAPWLDIAINGVNLTTLSISALSLTIGIYDLEVFQLTGGAIADFSYMFNNCYSLVSAPLLNTASGTNFSSMFSACISLVSAPLLNTASGTDFTSMFSNCRSLVSVPLLNTASGTNFSGMFSACYSLVSVPLLNTASGTNFTSMFNSCASLARGALSGTTRAISYSGCKLSAAELNEIYTNLGTASGAQTITVTGNYGTASDNPTIATAKGWTVTG